MCCYASALFSHKGKYDIQGLKLQYLLCNRLVYTIAGVFFVRYSDELCPD